MPHCGWYASFHLQEFWFDVDAAHDCATRGHLAKAKRQLIFISEVLDGGWARANERWLGSSNTGRN
jgi:hypothetical protein